MRAALTAAAEFLCTVAVAMVWLCIVLLAIVFLVIVSTVAVFLPGPCRHALPPREDSL